MSQMTTTVYYEINEWSIFKLTDLWNRDLVRLPIALFRDINQTKEMVSAFIQRLEFEDGYENEHSSQILFETKASILERMKDALGIEVLTWEEKVMDEESDYGQTLMAYLVVRFLDGRYRYFHCHITDYLHHLDRTVYGYQTIKEVEPSELPEMKELPLPTQLSQIHLFEKHLDERLEFSKRAAEFYQDQYKFEYAMAGNHYQSKYAALELIKELWNREKQNQPNSKSFISLIKQLKQSPILSEIEDNSLQDWIKQTNVNSVQGIFDWTLSYFEVA